ncbi:hypothetical protein MTR_7g071030 [Medicago truncatula]|uniref:Uncharacterized protein n=1 Tax=Medicago truncatula TaxID=3880 RepID=G7KV10_MEDTR|nr:hypothetical protein MTR_7g071030 [Medicago truncatula]
MEFLGKTCILSVQKFIAHLASSLVRQGEGATSWLASRAEPLAVARPKATQVISIGLGRTMERKRNSEHLKKTAPEAEVLLKR